MSLLILSRHPHKPGSYQSALLYSAQNDRDLLSRITGCAQRASPCLAAQNCTTHSQTGRTSCKAAPMGCASSCMSLRNSSSRAIQACTAQRAAVAMTARARSSLWRCCLLASRTISRRRTPCDWPSLSCYEEMQATAAYHRLMTVYLYSRTCV